MHSNTMHARQEAKPLVHGTNHVHMHDTFDFDVASGEELRLDNNGLVDLVELHLLVTFPTTLPKTIPPFYKNVTSLFIVVKCL